MQIVNRYARYLFVGNTLAAPGIDAVERAVATLNDGRIGVLQDGGIFKSYPVVPVDAISTAQNG